MTFVSFENSLYFGERVKILLGIASRVHARDATSERIGVENLQASRIRDFPHALFEPPAGRAREPEDVRREPVGGGYFPPLGLAPEAC